MSENDKLLGLTTSPPVKHLVLRSHTYDMTLCLQCSFVSDEKNPWGKVLLTCDYLKKFTRYYKQRA